MTQQCEINLLYVVTALKCVGLQGHIFFTKINSMLIMFSYVWKQSLGNEKSDLKCQLGILWSLREWPI